MRRGTYSIVARDPATGELGAAVHSHWFAVGAIVPWVRAGVGAVCTQSVAEPAYGPRILDLLARGSGARAALDQLLAEDESARFRQVGAVDARGGVGVRTGEGAIAFAGHETGAGFSAQANMMAHATVWGAMARAYDAAAGPLARRLQAALHAAEGQGGDVRGRQSAALLVAPAHGEPWQARVDLRVEDHADPLVELRRLLDLQRAYELAGDADELMGEGRAEEAAGRYMRASELAPDSDELLFWAGLAIAQNGDVRAGADAVRRAAAIHPGWLTLLERLSPDFAPAGEAVRRALEE
jgi:uncharacterized Ntn-hydrolase superfamily protein